MRVVKTALIALILSSATAVSAQTYYYLESPLLVGNMAGPDLLWDTPDDFTTIVLEPIPGSPISFTDFNPDGYASGYLINSDEFGTLGGSFETSGNVITSFNSVGTFNSLFFDPFNPVRNTITQGLTPGLSSSFTILPGNEATSVINVDGDNDGFSYSLKVAGNYWHFTNGDDYSSILSAPPEVIAQINFLLPLLPNNWESFFIGSETLTFLGSGFGLVALGGSVFYTTSPVPVPPAFVFFISALGGLGFIGRRGR